MTRIKDDHVWTEEEERQLAKLWASGLSAAKIGTTMRLTKNQVIGKARRIGLPPRPKCVYGDGPSMRERAVRTRSRGANKEQIEEIAKRYDKTLRRLAKE